MPIDKRLYMTYPNDEDLVPFSQNISPDAFVYVVEWSINGHSVVKVGYTATPSRWRSFVRRGATVRLIVRAHWSLALDLESFLHHRALSKEPWGFDSKDDARPHLGSGGGGWVECYRVSGEYVVRVVEAVIDDALVQG